ncbi:plasmid recombination protein, partial [Gemelliphila palaticanis]
MTQLSISFKTSTIMTNLKHNNRDLTEEEYSMKAHEHIQRENSKYNIEIIKGNLEKTYEKIFDEPLKEYNDKQKRNDRKIKNYLNHIKKSKKYDVQREFILAVGDKKVFEKNDIKFKVEFSEKILKPM